MERKLPGGWEWFDLENVLLLVRNGFSSGQNKDHLGYPVTRIETISEGSINPAKIGYAQEPYQKISNYRMVFGDILFSHINSVEHIGKTAIYEGVPKELYHGMNLLLLRPNAEIVVPKYLFYYMNNIIIRKYYQTRCKKAVNQASINQKAVVGIKVPVPPLMTQKKIVAILKKAEEIKRLRTQADEPANQLLQSVFLDMFGDPVKNPRGWKVKRLQELIDPNRPITYGILKPGPNINGGIPYIRVVDIQDEQINVAGLKRTSISIARLYKRSTLRSRDLLLSIRGQVGKLALVPDALGGANITQDTARLAPTESCCPEFLFGCLASSSIQQWMARNIKGMAVKGINLFDVKSIPIIVPPYPLQIRFSEIFNLVGKNNRYRFQSKKVINDIFDSLLQKAFTGELIA